MKFALLFLVTLTAFADVKTVTLLDKGEPNEAMVFHADHLWVGSSRTGFNADYKILVFDRADAKVAEMPIKHSVQFLYPYDASSVLAVGTGHSPNLTMYTIARKTKDGFQSSTKTIPMEAWANRWLGTVNGREYFTDPGGNSADESTDLSLPAQTIFRMAGTTPQYLPTRLRLPVGGLVVGKALFVIQKESIGGVKSNLGIVDTTTGKLSFAFSEPRLDLSGITKVSNLPEIAVIERQGNRLVVLNSQTLKVNAELDAGIEPRAIASVGRCVLVGSFSGRGVRVIERAKEGTYSSVSDLENPLPENEFRRLFNVTADPKTGKVYARSNFPCNPMMEACTDDYNRVIAWPAGASSCL